MPYKDPEKQKEWFINYWKKLKDNPENLEKHYAVKRKWRKENKEKINEKQREYRRKYMLLPGNIKKKIEQDRIYREAPENIEDIRDRQLKSYWGEYAEARKMLNQLKRELNERSGT